MGGGTVYTLTGYDSAPLTPWHLEPAHPKFVFSTVIWTHVFKGRGYARTRSKGPSDGRYIYTFLRKILTLCVKVTKIYKFTKYVKFKSNLEWVLSQI